MARPPKDAPALPPLSPALVSWAEALGEAIGRGVARGLDAAVSGALSGVTGRRGRTPRARCTVPGCEREARSKGLCSAHYQSERRRQLAALKPA